MILRLLGLQDLVPCRNAISFADWWHKTIKRCPKETWKGINSLIILTAWVLWKNGNSCVFYGKNPSLIILQRKVTEERHLWELAGAKGLQALARVTKMSTSLSVFVLGLVLVSIFLVVFFMM
ncbi:hypothetical protein PR202_ga20965 [Eleusine coracana subsp. coracana]|uniref:Uncharacterized protein n=1 Tax=Eleusine coracana subsp. coracana TaxID=191504 RepID=A0AAV5CZU4_ELECO|nr:hypothetical protein PR202_ga20965 [Eleusine coracana subsp. coracana]